MVKRDKVIPGTIVQVNKLPPGPPGPRFTGKFAMHERLDIQSKPFSSGGLNLVKVKREKTDQAIEVYYAFITNFCRLEGEKSSGKRKTTKKTQGSAPAAAEAIVNPGDEPDKPPS